MTLFVPSTRGIVSLILLDDALLDDSTSDDAVLEQLGRTVDLGA